MRPAVPFMYPAKTKEGRPLFPRPLRSARSGATPEITTLMFARSVEALAENVGLVKPLIQRATSRAEPRESTGCPARTLTKAVAAGLTPRVTVSVRAAGGCGVALGRDRGCRSFARLEDYALNYGRRSCLPGSYIYRFACSASKEPDRLTLALKRHYVSGRMSSDEPAVSNCVRRVAQAIINAGTRNKWVHFPRTPEEKAAVNEGFLRLGPLPGVIGCVDGSFVAIVAPRGEQKASFWCRKGYYALNVMFICDADMRILAVDPLRPGSDHDSHIWGTTWVRERFEEGRIDTTGEYLLGDGGYPLEPWLMVPVQGHPHRDSAEGKYNSAHASMRSIVGRCIGLLKSRFRCLQRYRTRQYSPERSSNIVAACVVLHNLCIEQGDIDVDDFSDDSGDESSEHGSSINDDPQPRFRRGGHHA
ncbi:hypothetical protein MTO96_015645 [Rhipicephalus appendiculatus]